MKRIIATADFGVAEKGQFWSSTGVAEKGVSTIRISVMANFGGGSSIGDTYHRNGQFWDSTGVAKKGVLAIHIIAMANFGAAQSLLKKLGKV